MNVSAPVEPSKVSKPENVTPPEVTLVVEAVAKVSAPAVPRSTSCVLGLPRTLSMRFATFKTSVTGPVEPAYVSVSLPLPPFKAVPVSPLLTTNWSAPSWPEAVPVKAPVPENVNVSAWPPPVRFSTPAKPTEPAPFVTVPVLLAVMAKPVACAFAATIVSVFAPPVIVVVTPAVRLNVSFSVPPSTPAVPVMLWPRLKVSLPPAPCRFSNEEKLTPETVPAFAPLVVKVSAAAVPVRTSWPLALPTTSSIEVAVSVPTPIVTGPVAPA